MSYRIGFGWEQPEAGDAGLYIYNDVDGSIVAGPDNDPPDDVKTTLSDALVVADATEITQFLDSRRYIRWRDKMLVDRHDNEYGVWHHDAT